MAFNHLKIYRKRQFLLLEIGLNSEGDLNFERAGRIILCIEVVLGFGVQMRSTNI